MLLVSNCRWAVILHGLVVLCNVLGILKLNYVRLLSSVSVMQLHRLKLHAHAFPARKSNGVVLISRYIIMV